ncbi:MAG: GNAT family N-acetyltransferase [Anaerolineae bacterium]
MEYLSLDQGCRSAQLEMVLASVAEENTEAQTWVFSHSDNALLVLLWDKGNNVFYLFGTPPHDKIVRDIQELIDSEIRERAIAEGRAHFGVRALSPALAEVVPRIFHRETLQQRRHLFYGFHRTQPEEVATPTVEGVAFFPIDDGLLQRDDLSNTCHVRHEIRWMWPSEERFRQRGFGYAAVMNETMICWCTAEYVSRRACGVGIETARDYRNRGVGTATAARFVREALRRGITPHWECDADNGASRRVAAKVGFEKLEEAVLWRSTYES